MNVTQLVKSLGTSKPTFYGRVRNAGINLDDLRDKATGELTPEGVGILAALFDTTTAPAPDERKDVTPEIEVLRTQLEAARHEAELLRELLEAKDAELHRMAEDLEAWRAKAQEINVRQLLLAAAEVAPRRRSFIEWLTGRKRDQASTDE